MFRVWGAEYSAQPSGATSCMITGMLKSSVWSWEVAAECLLSGPGCSKLTMTVS